MCEFPSAAMVSNRCWSVMMNKISGRIGVILFGTARSSSVVWGYAVAHPHLALTRLPLPARERIEVRVRAFCTPSHARVCKPASIFLPVRFPSDGEMLRDIWRKFSRSLLLADAVRGEFCPSRVSLDNRAQIV